MFKYYNLKEKFLTTICFDAGEDKGGGGQGGQEKTGEIDYSKILEDPKFQEALIESEFLKKHVQSAEDRVRTKYTGEKKSVEQEVTTLRERVTLLDGERLENIKTKVVEELGIPLKYRNRIKGTTQEEMLEDAKLLKADLLEFANSEVEIRLKGAGTDPNKEKVNDKMDKALESFNKHFKF